ncbi:MAG: multiubiquitin domain-containing protein [Candidatus Dormibacteraeota bacterium]|nr:multiubiquitin domain-containing protein [Candidatus Dormibacteraeota bacterium]
MNVEAERGNDAQDHEHEVTIVVNGREKTVTGKTLSFDELLRLAFDPVPTGTNWVFTVTYRKGDDEKSDGTLVAGQTVKIKKGMIFNVTATDKS